VVVFDGAAPSLAAHRVGGAATVIGRELFGNTVDDRLSREHARVRLADGAFAVSDLASRNGTYVNGQRITEETWVHPPAVVRTGRTLTLLVRDVRRFEEARVLNQAGAVIGPQTGQAILQIQRAARGGDTLLVTGESGTGKELAARAFHVATGASGELIAVNCAAIPGGMAERLLFGTRRGAYSGADRDADGYLAAADRGTIFLDEVGELELAVQGKLLRVLETREVMPLGASKPKKLDLRIVVATLRDLRAEVAARRFRDDLYYRIGRPEVRLPALRERPEEIPWLIAATVADAAPGLGLHVSLVEGCLLRSWPGNVRELVAEVRLAALSAREDGSAMVKLDDLDASAGAALGAPAEITTADGPRVLPDDASIAAALAAEAGNVTRAARALGVHRNQLRRYLASRPPST
jgi:transcriptional regulator with PAS, ATPase and Fis domain